MNHPIPTIVQPDGGKKLEAFGIELTVLISGEQSGGKLAVMSELIPPGGGPPPHVHHNEDELFLVIEGPISYFLDGEWTEVAAGGAIYLPKDTPHTYRNTSSSFSRHWVLTTPSGFENFFEKSAVEFAKPTGPDMGRIVEIALENGIEFLQPADNG